MGHEFIGMAEETTPGGDLGAPGRFVISTFVFQDNTCVFRRAGFQAACVHGG